MSIKEDNREAADATQTNMELEEQQEDLGPMAVESLCMNCHKNVSPTKEYRGSFGEANQNQF